MKHISFFRFPVLLILAGVLSLPAFAQKHWWEREPIRIIDLTTSISRIDARDPAEVAARKGALGYNTEHFEVMGMPAGLDDRHFFFKSDLATVKNPDYLGAYLPHAKKHGIRSLIYFNVHWYTMAMGQAHPDWRQIREDGTPVDKVYDTGTDFCVNSPWRQWCFQVLRDLAAYPIDGIFYDGPVFRPDSCYCTHCRTKFRKMYGREMPSKKNRTGKDFKDLIDFQAASLADYLRESRQVLKSINPELAFYMNGGVRGSNWATARINRVLVKEQDLLGSEGGFIAGDLTRTPLWKPGLTARMLETQAGGKPTVIFSASSHKPWTFSLLPDAELRLLYADSIANAANIWFCSTPFEFDQPEMKTLAEMNQYLKRSGEYYMGTRSEARMAVVWSETTANFYAGAGAQMIDVDRIAAASEAGNLEAEFTGVSEALLRAHAPFDVIDDEALERESLDRYEAIFLPNVACMSDAVAARLREYVRKGGRLFATFETSVFDDTGIRRKDFALADVFGVNDARKLVGPTRWDFMKPMAKDPLLAGITRDFVPSSIYHMAVKPSSSVKTLLRFTEPLKGRYDGVPPLSDHPAMTVNTFGKGQAVYFSGDFGSMIASFHTPEFLELGKNLVRTLAPPPVQVANAPGSVEVVLRSQNNGKRWLVHLVNFTGEMTRPIRSVVSLPDVKITVPDGRKAYSLFRSQPLPITKDAQGRAQVVLPRLNEYEVVVFER
ncbi:MAG TPA: beta-galactosidase trimerization domain-containing protein [Bryobacteraceae bacterium]|nr:beta-galactosidase trimerization domain-containing protein [Bryobacteraceae bacterium]